MVSTLVPEPTCLASGQNFDLQPLQENQQIKKLEFKILTSRKRWATQSWATQSFPHTTQIQPLAKYRRGQGDAKDKQGWREWSVPHKRLYTTRSIQNMSTAQFLSLFFGKKPPSVCSLFVYDIAKGGNVPLFTVSYVKQVPCNTYIGLTPITTYLIKLITYMNITQ